MVAYWKRLSSNCISYGNREEEKQENLRHVVAAFLIFGGIACGQDAGNLSLKSRIELPGVYGRIDHFSADLKSSRIFVSALGNGRIEVLDVKAGQPHRTIANLAEPQGVYYDAATNILFVACARDGTVKLFEAATLELVATAAFSSDADNIRYDARGHRVIVGYGDGSLGFLDLQGKKTGEIRLDAHPESFQLEKAGTRLFVNVPDRKEIEVVDLARNAVTAKWPVTSALKNYPMALDEAHHRLLIGCRAPARLLVIDTESGKQTASLETTGDTDDLFYDAARNRVYVIGGEGYVDVFEQRDADHYSRVAHEATAPGARTGLFVPGWRELFVGVPHRGEQRAQVLVYDTK